jgi:5,10-methylenetetrahydromethanopterin reductase
VAPERRHLHVHEGHCLAPPARELPFLDPGLGALTFSGSEAELRERWRALEAAGATELAYAPAGRDVARELRAMARVAGL